MTSTRPCAAPSSVLVVAALAALLLAGAAARAQDAADDPSPRDRIESLQAEIDRIEAGLPAPSAEETRALRTEVETKREEMRDIVGTLMDRAADDAALRAFLLETLAEDDAALMSAITRRRADITELRGELEGASGDERLRIENLLTKENEALDRLFASVVTSLERRARLGADVEAEGRALEDYLILRAETTAGLIQTALAERDRLQERVAQAPDDAGLAAELAGWREKVRGTTTSLQATADAMERRGLDTAEYRALLITATGKITGDILDADVAFGLGREWLDKARAWTVERAPGIAFNALLFVLIVLLFRLLASLARRAVRRGLEKSGMGSTLLREFLIGLSAKTVLIIGILVALSQIGVSLGPMLAGLGIAGFIVGFALQDTLSNFASGLMILAYRPFDVGDVIEGGGVKGIVSHMSLVSTTIRTFDNEKLIVPNNKIWGDVIRNVTAQTTRRVDLVFGISYGDDIEHAERVLGEIIAGHPDVLDDPPAVIKLHTLGESSVDFIVRPWVATENYWTVYWDVTRAVKQRFDAEGISIPFPQRDVHLYGQAGQGSPQAP